MTTSRKLFLLSLPAFCAMASLSSHSHAQMHNNQPLGQQESKDKPSLNANQSLQAQAGSSSQFNQKVMSYGVGQINSGVEQWLKQYGTSRIKINVDDRGRLDGTDLDLLLALYDNQTDIVFTQLGLRRYQSRSTINLGLGYRTPISDATLVGINTFIDQDLTGHNQRMSVGAEAFKDYLRLRTNAYFRLSNWREAYQLEGYQERPANGFDLQLEAYLPSYPQLGGKLIYEQYKGDEVALFGTSRRQKNPYALTLGVNHTPFPLLSYGIEHRQGKGSEHDTRIQLSLTYRLGESIEKQLSSSNVDSMRRFMAGRKELVERNNNIVLEYRKHDSLLIIPIILANNIRIIDNLQEADGVQTNSVQVTVTDRRTGKVLGAGIPVYFIIDYGTRSETISLTTDANGQVWLKFPSNTVGQVPVSASLNNNTGSQQVVTEFIEPNPGDIKPPQPPVDPDSTPSPASLVDNVTLTITQNNSFADGVAVNSVAAFLKDANDKPVKNVDVEFFDDSGTLIGRGRTNADGIATLDVATLVAGPFPITAKVVGNNQIAPVNTSVTFKSIQANLDTIKIQSFAPDTNTLIANKNDDSTKFKAVVVDDDGVLARNTEVTFTYMDADGNPKTVNTMTNDQGVAELVISGATDGVSPRPHGPLEITAKVVNAQGGISEKQAQVTFVFDESSLSINALTIGSAVNHGEVICSSYRVTDSYGPIANIRTVLDLSILGSTPIIDLVSVTPSDQTGLGQICVTSQYVGRTALAITVEGYPDVSAYNSNLTFR